MKPVLYHSVSARSFRPLWAMEELGLDYELKMLPFPPRATQREFLDVNPLGTVPALLAGGALMTESAAMCQYLATRDDAAPGLALAQAVSPQPSPSLWPWEKPAEDARRT